MKKKREFRFFDMQFVIVCIDKASKKESLIL